MSDTATSPLLATRDALVEGVRATGAEFDSVGGYLLAERIADALLASGVVRDPATLADDDRLLTAGSTAVATAYRDADPHLPSDEDMTRHVVHALAAALTGDPS